MSDERVWLQLVQLLESMAAARSGESFRDHDRALAAEVAAAPGRLESRLLTGMDDLAARACPDASHPSLLGYFWNLSLPGDPLLISHPQVFRDLPDPQS